MADDSLEASAIEIDHNAMLASDPKENAAFLKFFGRFQHSSLEAPGGATQLSQLAPKLIHRRKSSHVALARLNSKLASRMQAQLTATSHADVLPKFKIGASRSARRAGSSSSSQLAIKVSSPATLDALDMTDSHTHILPNKLRTEFAIRHGKKVLTRKLPGLRFESLDDTNKEVTASKQLQPESHSDITSAGKADDNLLASIPKNTNAADLIKRAALEQMKQLHGTAVAQKRPAQIIASPLQKYPYSPPQGQAMYPASPYQAQSGYSTQFAYPAQAGAAYPAQPAAGFPAQPMLAYPAPAYSAPPAQQALFNQPASAYYPQQAGYYAAPPAPAAGPAASPYYPQ